MTAPHTIYVLVDTSTGSLKIGGGSSTKPAPKAFATLEEARRSRNRLRDKDNIDILEYTWPGDFHI